MSISYILKGLSEYLEQLVMREKELNLFSSRHAIRYHLLVNPTGRKMKWRAVDWCVELNNLFTKVRVFTYLL